MVLAQDERTHDRLKETCVLLAGGVGRRMTRLTGGRNKHLLPIAGRPALRHVIDTVVATWSVDKLVVVTTPDSLVEVEALVRDARADVETVVRAQPAPMGTLDAVISAGGDIDHDSFVVHYGDNLFAWSRLPSLPASLPPDTSACLYAASTPPDWQRLAVIRTRGNSGGPLLATDLVEKPSEDVRGPGTYALTGCLRFDTEAFWHEAPLVQLSSRGEFELTDVVRRMIKRSRVAVVPVAAPWIDFGTESGLAGAAAVLAARGDRRA